jgi:hypothetical protein
MVRDDGEHGALICESHKPSKSAVRLPIGVRESVGKATTPRWYIQPELPRFVVPPKAVRRAIYGIENQAGKVGPNLLDPVDEKVR